MQIEKYLQNDQIIIVPGNKKEKILKQISASSFYNFKLMSFDEIAKKLLFDYDDDAIIYLMDKYQLKLEVSKVYLKNMYYIENRKYESKKIDNLVKLKQELNDNNLLIKDILFKDYLKRYSVLVYGFDHLGKWEEYIIEKIKEITTCFTILEENKDEKVIPYYYCNNLEEEVDILCFEILKLHEKGIPFDKMHVVNVQEEYLMTIKRLFSFYHIPVNIPSKSTLYSTLVVSNFLKRLESGDSIYEIYESSIKQSKYQNLILPIINRFYLKECSKKTLIELFKDAFLNVYINNEEYQSSVSILSLEEEFDEDDYVFVLSVNQNILPKLYKDEEYFTDKDKVKYQLPLDLIVDKNVYEKETLKNKFYKIKNIILFSKSKSFFDEYYPSSILSELLIDNKEIPLIVDRFKYSNLYNKIRLSKGLDNFIKYGSKDYYTSVLLTHYKDIPYLSYDNSFTKIDKNLFKQIIPTNKLSYSKLDTYYHCAFSYYLKYIMKVDSYKESFSQFIGNLYHKLLSNMYLDNFDFDYEWDSFLKTKEHSKSELFFLSILKKQFKLVLDNIYRQQNLSSFNKHLCEKNFNVNLLEKEKINFSGIIDKILYKEKENKTYLVLVDYKTGSITDDIKYVKYGFNLQLPVYLYLVKNSNYFNNPTITGFYFQKILHSKVSYDPKKNYQKEIENRFKLMGYSTNNENILEQFDITYQNSEVIKSMKVTKNGFSHYSKVFDDAYVDNLINIVLEKIIEANDNISKANFIINPKQIGKDNIGCKNCHYQDICYMRFKDLVYLEEESETDVDGEMDS